MSRRNWQWTGVSLLSIVLFAAHTVALSEYQTRQITQYLDSPKLQQNKDIFDGQAFIASVSLDQATQYYKDYVNQMNRAVQSWNKLSNADKRSPDAQPLLTQLQNKVKWFKAMEAAFPDFQASKASQTATTSATTKSAPTSAGGMSPYQKRSVTQHLDSRWMQRNHAIFDGTDFVDGVAFETVESYHRRFNGELEKAKRAWNNQISSSARATPDGHALRNRLVDAQNWANAMAKKYPAVKAQFERQQKADAAARVATQQASTERKTQHKAQCATFQSQAMTPLNRDPILRLINQATHQNSRISSVDQINNHAQVAGEVAEVCNQSDLAALRAKPCWYVLNRPEHDPIRWCEVAQNATPHIRAAVLNHAKSVVATTGSSTIQSPKQFMERDGFLTFEGPVTFTKKLHFSGGLMTPVMGPVSDLLAAVGIEDAENELWGEQKQRLNELRAAVEASAADWQSPADQGQNYSTKLVTQQVRRMHPDAEVHTAFLSRASWKIHRNALGVILRRTLPGYVLFKLPDDPFCQLRSYTLTEPYSGGGTYQEASGVRMGYVRFQSCPK